MRVVVDPNLLVSYFLTHRRPIAQIIDVHLAHEDFTLLICTQLLEELDSVLQYTRFQRYFNNETRLRFVALIAALSELVDLPENVPAICRHPADDWVIATAVAGNADVIISGNRHLLELKQVGKTHILSPRLFLERLSKI